MIIRKLFTILALSLLFLSGCAGGGGSSSQGTLSGSTDGTGLERYYFGEVESLVPNILLVDFAVVLEATGEQVPVIAGTYSLRTQFNGLEAVNLRFIGTASDGSEVDTTIEIPELPEDLSGVETIVGINPPQNIAEVESFELYTRDEVDEVQQKLPKPEKEEAESVQSEIEELTTTPSEESEENSFSKPNAPGASGSFDSEIDQETEFEIDAEGIL